MDPPLSPPVHIHPIASTPITLKATQKRLEDFLEDFQARSTSAQGGNTAVTVQLQKLTDALKEERKAKKERPNVDDYTAVSSPFTTHAISTMKQRHPTRTTARRLQYLTRCSATTDGPIPDAAQRIVAQSLGSRSGRALVFAAAETALAGWKGVEPTALFIYGIAEYGSQSPFSSEWTQPGVMVLYLRSCFLLQRFSPHSLDSGLDLLLVLSMVL
ncbi:hypothetical protein BJ912DRAFT_1087228 [Pholiota molesta]|nr:hypothetical protein BJ912DRAFT_1087228 [Pholiota molesta]